MQHHYAQQRQKTLCTSAGAVGGPAVQCRRTQRVHCKTQLAVHPALPCPLCSCNICSSLHAETRCCQQHAPHCRPPACAPQTGTCLPSAATGRAAQQPTRIALLDLADHRQQLRCITAGRLFRSWPGLLLGRRCLERLHRPAGNPRQLGNRHCSLITAHGIESGHCRRQEGGDCWGARFT